MLGSVSSDAPTEPFLSVRDIMEMEYNAGQAGQGAEEEKPKIVMFDKKVTSAFLGESNG